MYAAHYHLREPPFSIAPDPAFLYLSARHQEALGHLLYGTGQYGGFVQLTGEVGTGKTTIIRTLLSQKLANVDIAMIHNPRQSELEFVASICDELSVAYPPEAVQPGGSIKTLVDALNEHLLKSHAAGRRTVLIIDEAQNLPQSVLEQVRLLTNLETNKEKLLRIMLIGQPELTELLGRADLRQLSSRITARFHLTPLTLAETMRYIGHRLHVAGGAADLFSEAAMYRVHRYARGIPRQINIICDRSLLGAYAKGYRAVTPAIVDQAAVEVFGAAVQKKVSAWQGFSQLFSKKLPLSWVEGALAVAALVIAGVLLNQALNNRAAITAAAPAPTPPVAAPAVEAAVTPPASVEPRIDDSGPPLDAGVGALRASAQPLANVMETLIGLWQPQLDIPRGENVCAALSRSKLECYKGYANWDDLRHMNRPAILTLTQDDGRQQFVLLRQLAGDSVQLQTASGALRMPLQRIDPLWNGQFLLLWEPEIPVKEIGPKSTGDAITWLRIALAKSEGKKLSGPLPTNYGPELRAQLIRFQAARGLDATGFADTRTLIALSDVSRRTDTPTLEATP